MTSYTRWDRDAYIERVGRPEEHRLMLNWGLLARIRCESPPRTKKEPLTLSDVQPGGGAAGDHPPGLL